MKLPLILIAAATPIILTGCAKSGTKPAKLETQSNCQKIAVIDESVYNATSINYGITGAVINGDCLEIKFAASGCSGTSWVVDLVGTNDILESNPPQRYLRMKLTNNEVCTAMPSKTVTFDLTPLRIANTHAVRLLLEGYIGTLMYSY